MNARIKTGSWKTRQSGYSLIEVLITIVITSIGLLGLAGMQAAGLRNNHSAYQHSQATVLAYDMSDRMRANTSALDSYLTSVTPVVVTPSESTQGVSSGISIQVDVDGDPVDSTPAVSPCATTTGCTTTAMAANDLAEWNADLAAVLPGGVGTITAVGSIFTVTVNWDDNRDGAVDGNDPNFQVSFQP